MTAALQAALQTVITVRRVRDSAT